MLPRAPHLLGCVECAVQLRRNAPAFHDPNAVYTWLEFAGAVRAWADQLRAAGVRAGDRVTLLSFNSVAMFAAMYAIWRAGALAVPLNFRLADAELAGIDADCRPLLLLADTDHLPGALRIAEVRPALAVGSLPGLLDQTLILHQAGRPEAAVNVPVEVCTLLYTGGTTGRPKGVMITDAALLVQSQLMAQAVALDADSVYIHSAPLFHVADLHTGLAVSLMAGSHVFMPQFSPAGLALTAHRHAATHLVGVPTMLQALVNAPRFTAADFSSVRSISYGAAPMPPSVLARVRAAFPDAALHQFYGQTETSGAVTYLGPRWHRDMSHARLAGAGCVVPAHELAVMAPGQSQIMAPGRTGEVCVRGPALMAGYWSDGTDESPASPIDSAGWLHTGDIGVLDEDGFVTLVDRLRDMVVSGGENVYSIEVENCIAACPGVRECAVIGMPDALWGERVHAVVVVESDGADVAAFELTVRNHCRAVLAGYKMPRSFTFRTQALPVSGVGKIRKNMLREQLALEPAALAG